MKYAVVTFGCRVNQADSLAIEGALRMRGATAASGQEADLVIVNTCSVTASADQGVRQTVRRIHRENPSAQFIVTGCYASREPELIAALPNVIRVVPNREKDALLEVIDGLGPSTAERFGDGGGACGGLEPGVGGRTALTLRVQTGCDQSCSYCVIPQTRGAGRSRPMPDVVAAIGQAVEAGYKEIAITGVHLGSYGRDLADGTTLTRLVRSLAEWPSDVLFRLGSLEPMDCAEAIVDEVVRSPRLAPHFHLPLQHGTDRVLQAMDRPYTTHAYRRLVDGIRSRMPDAAIGCDLIVGFPGETDEEFEHMRGFVAALPVTQLHVFPYSDRPGTVATGMRGKVHGAVIRERAGAMRAIGAALAAEFRRGQAGSVRRALTVDDGWSVVTDNHFKVRLGERHPRNRWVQVPVPP